MVPLAKYLTEGQDPETVEKLMGKVAALLVAGEEIECLAVQQKPLFNAFPDCVAMTPLRVIFCRLRNFGLHMEFKAYWWPDVMTMQFVEDLANTSLTVKTAKVTEVMGYLPQMQARRLHDFARVKEKEAEHASARSAKNRGEISGASNHETQSIYRLSLAERGRYIQEGALLLDPHWKGLAHHSPHRSRYS
jgi:hypothetical protein